MQQRVNPRKAALEILHRVEKQQSNSALLLQETLRDVESPSDRGLITDLVLGTLRWRERLLYVIQSYSKLPLNRIDRKVVLLLQMGIYELLHTGVAQHAAIHETVEICKKIKLSSAASFVNGILRTVQKNLASLPEPSEKDSVSYLSTLFSHPKWLVSRWVDRFGPLETESLLTVNNKPAPVFVRINELTINVEEARNHLKDERIQVAETEFGPGLLRVSEGSPQSTRSFANGEFYIQDAAVEVVCRAIDPQPGWQVLEIAAAPGGKTFQLALHMKNRGKIVSIDLDWKRMELWRENISRLKLVCALPVIADAQAIPLQYQFDAVFIDAPCSSLGIIRRHPEIRWRRKPEELTSFQILQLKILGESARLVRDHGMLFYSVCSFEPEETTQVTEQFLTDHAGFQLVQTLTLLPHQSRTDGFFLAGFQKKS